MSGYTAGRRVEYRWSHYFRDNGYEVQRGASSKGVADLLCFKPGQVLLVNVKKAAMPSPEERRYLAQVAAMLPGVAVPVIARGKNLLRVTDDGTDPKACVPFTVEEVAP